MKFFSNRSIILSFARVYKKIKHESVDLRTGLWI